MSDANPRSGWATPPAEVNVPDRILLVAIVFMEFDQLAVLQHGNTQPGLGLIDDQFDVHASRKDGLCTGHDAQTGTRR